MIGALVLATVLAAQTAPPVRTVKIAAPNATLTLEIADTPGAREYGLMFRTQLASHGGMIFVFPQEGRQSFWMKNTLIPLDMIFVRANGTIDTIAADVPASKAGDDDVARREGDGKYVIELAAGEARADGLHVGLRLSIPKLDAES